MDENLIVHDEFITESAEKVVTQGEALQGIVDSYISILQSTHGEAITEGAIADTLEQFIAAAQQLGVLLTDISTQTGADLNSYLSEIDTNDRYLF